MIKFITLAFVLVSLVIECTGRRVEVLTTKQTNITLAFGSCFKNYNKNTRYDIFNTIANLNPDVFMWTGDVIYAGSGVSGFKRHFGFPRIVELFNELKFNQSSSYSLILDYEHLDRNTKIIGVWDDHDYGMSNGSFLFLTI